MWGQNLVLLHEALEQALGRKRRLRGLRGSPVVLQAEKRFHRLWARLRVSLLSRSLTPRLLLGYGSSWCCGGARRVRVGAATVGQVHHLPVVSAATPGSGLRRGAVLPAWAVLCHGHLPLPWLNEKSAHATVPLSSLSPSETSKEPTISPHIEFAFLYLLHYDSFTMTFF